MSIYRPLLVIGTRPEAIKMAPVLFACREHPSLVPQVCVTGQHRELLEPVLEHFAISADVRLDVMRGGQSLAQLTARLLDELDGVLAEVQPDCLVAQGDTATVMAASLAAFYRRVPFVHVEAGLRTGNLDAPWPEELHRRVTSLSAALHLAPTSRAAGQLIDSGVPAETIQVTGNTVIDALLWTRRQEQARSLGWQEQYAVWENRPLVLVTCHRRENFGEGLSGICQALIEASRHFPEVEFVLPVHQNPQVRETVHSRLAGLANLHLLPPLAYPEFVWMMDRAKVILTDSGGIQEEAPSLGKPVLLLRETTERPEAVECGATEIVGTSPERIVAALSRLLTDPVEYARRQVDHNPFGDGQAGQRCAHWIAELLARRGGQSVTSADEPSSAESCSAQRNQARA